MNDGDSVPGSETQSLRQQQQSSASSGFAAPPQYPFPLTFSQILDRVFFLLRTHFGLLVGVGVVPFAALFVLLAAPMAYLFFQTQRMTLPGATPQFSWLFFPIFLLIFILSIAVNAIYMAAASHAALSADCGIRLTVSHCLHLAWERAGRNIGLYLMMTVYAMAPLLILLLAIALFAGVFAAFHHGSPAIAAILMPLMFLALIGGYIWMFILMLRLSLAFPASVAEDLTAVEAIRRSGYLTRGAKWRIFLAMLVVYAGTYVVMLAMMAVAGALSALAALAFGGFHQKAQPWSFFGFIFLVPIWLAMMVLSTAVPLAAVMTALAVFYRDQRLRVDGYNAVAQR